MHPIKIICDKRTRRDGTNPLYIQYCFSGEKRTLLNTGISVSPSYWNKKTGKVSKDHPQVNTHNKELQKQLRVVEDLIEIATEKKIDPLPFVKKTFKPDLDHNKLSNETSIAEWDRQTKNQKEKVKKTFYFQLEDYMHSKERKVSPVMQRIYRNMRHHLEEFEKYRGIKITFEMLDLTFYEQLVDFLTYDYVLRRRTSSNIKGLRVNTIGKTIKELRTFLRNRIRKKIIAPIDMEGWTILEEEIDAVYLSWAEIEKIKHADLTAHPHLIRYRDDFVLGCMTGLRFSDYSTIQPQDIRDNMLYKKQQKSNHWVVIPLRAEARNILMKRFSEKHAELTNVLFNRYIKEIAKLAGLTEKIKHSYKKGNKTITEIKPKSEWVMSHTCRRSFCTNEFLAGTPVELIMKISGHKSVKDFYKYIRISPEEAGRKILQIWQEREKEKVFDSPCI
jgi:site-specific recombinase XerD